MARGRVELPLLLHYYPRFMQAARLSALGCAALIGSSLLLSCGDDEATDGPVPSVSDGGGGDASTSLGGVGAGGAPSNSGATGGSATSTAGSGAAAGQSDGGVTSSGAAGPGGAGGAPLVESGEQLTVCERLDGRVALATAVGRAYVQAAYDDCRVTWIVPLGAALADFKQGIVTWSYQFWGCPGTPRVENFALVSGAPPLSAGDVQLLIDLYMAAASPIERLNLSGAEATEMRAALERLAQPLITDPAEEPSNSQCAAGGAAGTGAAGAAGTGAADAGAAGAGSTP